MKSTLALVVIFIITLLLLCFMSDRLAAQNTKSDSLKHLAISRDSLGKDSIAEADKTRQTAKWDAGRLKLTPEQRQLFNTNKQNTNSDLFKPNAALARNSSLLQDSVYVKAFRQAAYNKALGYRKRTTGHYVLLGGIILAGAAVVSVIALGIFLDSSGFGSH